MNRLVPYRTKALAEVAMRIEQTLNTTMYLVQTSGPTSYVIQEQNCEKKHKVLIGSLQTCSCGTADICIHILFVMLKVFRVPATIPVVWQKSLIDSEIEMLLQGGYREKSKPVPRPYMKRRKEESTTSEPGDAGVDRHELVEGEVCAICQEDMEDSQPLTFCRKGCGNNFHIECMKVFGESRRQSKDNIICPLCRQDWGGEALASLRKEIDAANRAPNVHKGASCRKCKTKPIRCERYRCVQCKNVDLCARCFKSKAHLSHAFVMKQNALDPWIPALRENHPQTAISSDIMRDLETRELSMDDYEILLQLDGDKCPIQDYLVKVVSGTKINAESAKSFGVLGTTCSLCAQSLQMKAALHSTLCGHTFHESCLARSILSQVYVCPFPGCEHTLVPGLRYLQKKTAKRTMQHTVESKHELQTVVSSPNAPFTVVGLQQHMEVQGPRAMKLRVANSRAVQKERYRHEDSEIRALPDLVSVGISQNERATRNLPAFSQRGASNQLEHEAIVCSSTTSSTRESAPKRKGKISKTALLRNALPPIDQRDPLPPFQHDNNLTEIRLNHAEKIRAELMAVERERLRQQRMLREERRQRYNESTNTPAFVGGFLGANERDRERVGNGPGAQAPQSTNFKRKQHIGKHHQLPISLPDLFIGSKR